MLIRSESSSEVNMTFVKPQGFYIAGFKSLWYSQYYFVFLSLVYLVTLLSNFLLMAIIVFVHSLHTPKYIAIFTLSVIDISYSTALIPKSVDAFVFNTNFVLYETCLTQMFFVLFFSAMESVSIAILSYDRFISICFPLQSMRINTNKRMFIIIGLSWIIPFAASVSCVILITRLSFCRTVVINSYYCDHGPIVNLACNDNTPNWVAIYFGVVVFFFTPLVFIIMSYACIIYALLKITSSEGRHKAFKTCTTHLTVVAIFYLPLLIIYMMSWLKLSVDTNTRIFNVSIAASIPPLLNSVVYTLKTNEILEEVKKIFKRKITNNLTFH